MKRSKRKKYFLPLLILSIAATLMVLGLIEPPIKQQLVEQPLNIDLLHEK